LSCVAAGVLKLPAPLPQKAKNKKKSPEKLYLQRKYPAF